MTYDDFRGIIISPVLFKIFEHCLMDGFQTFSRVEMSAFIRSPYSRGTTTAAAAAARKMSGQSGTRASSDNFRGVGNGNGSSCCMTTAAKCASWRHVLASHWCRVDMRGSANLVLCACIGVPRILQWRGFT